MSETHTAAPNSRNIVLKLVREPQRAPGSVKSPLPITYSKKVTFPDAFATPWGPPSGERRGPRAAPGALLDASRDFRTSKKRLPERVPETGRKKGPPPEGPTWAWYH